MKLLSLFFKSKKSKRKTLADYKQKVLVELGREQFKRLLDKGLGIPITVF